MEEPQIERSEMKHFFRDTTWHSSDKSRAAKVTCSVAEFSVAEKTLRAEDCQLRSKSSAAVGVEQEK